MELGLHSGRSCSDLWRFPHTFSSLRTGIGTSGRILENFRLHPLHRPALLYGASPAALAKSTDLFLESRVFLTWTSSGDTVHPGVTIFFLSVPTPCLIKLDFPSIPLHYYLLTRHEGLLSLCVGETSWYPPSTYWTCIYPVSISFYNQLLSKSSECAVAMLCGGSQSLCVA